MDNAVRRLNVGRDDTRLVDHDLTVFLRDLQSRTLQRHHFARLGFSAQNLPRDDVVGQYSNQRVLIFRLQQRFHGALGQFRKRLVGRGEDGQRTITLQRIDESGRLNRRNQRVKRASRDRSVDDVLRCRFGAGEGQRSDRG